MDGPAFRYARESESRHPLVVGALIAPPGRFCEDAGIAVRRDISAGPKRLPSIDRVDNVKKMVSRGNLSL